ncbi:hypothetical protein HBB16_12485 [Pseudonocardia sp. MCCB 268]|nr:hypothetical protein [Pseudonocardia cytotoxica]
MYHTRGRRDQVPGCVRDLIDQLFVTGIVDLSRTPHPGPAAPTRPPCPPRDSPPPFPSSPVVPKCSPADRRMTRIKITSQRNSPLTWELQINGLRSTCRDDGI